MKISKPLRFIITLVLVSLLVFSSAALSKTYKLTILHTNDQHGHFRTSNYTGGVAAQSTLVNIVRAEVAEAGGHTLLLSAGDVNRGTPESDMLDAEPDFKAMNMIGYDAMALGNHEFDKLYKEVLLKQIGWAEFPLLSANVINQATGEPLVEPYIIKQFEGLKVAIFGLTTEEVPIIATPEYVEDLEFKNAIDTAKILVPKLRGEADIVIALTHLGFKEGGYGYIGFDATSDVELAGAVQGIDVIVGGHTHDALEQPEVVCNTLIVQAGEYGKYVGRLDLTVDSDANTVTEHTYNLLPVNRTKRITYNDKNYYMYVGTAYVEDPQIVELLSPYLARSDELLSRPIGEALLRLDGDRKLVRSQETNMGNLITDAMRVKTGADIAFQNGGGIRASIEAGTITYRDLLTVQSFGNTLVIIKMTGAQIMKLLTYAAMVEDGQGAFLHVSGLSWTNNKKVPENVMVGNTPIELEKTYTVVTNNFMGGGGDGYAMLKDLPKTDTGFVDADALREYIEKAGKVKPMVEGRLTIIN
ncbi:MAG: 5'-nucleotidase C-terminal domain-containing protein [Deltaproteobacteria bacterium]|nr:5'-nucleotidase C-terminal domain-containing protein [Deltaproteobacteria bacterium]